MWRYEFKKCVTDVDELKNYIDFMPGEEKKLKKVAERHPLFISRYYLSLIDKNDVNDPIRKMAIPSVGELDLSGSYDTSGEKQNTKMPGLQHKYSQTALILATNRCAVFCRHCFRKRLVGLPTEEIMHRFRDAVKYITDHKEINNVLISGGDPLVLPTTVIAKFLEKLSNIDHLDFIRFGSRTPVAFPDRLIEDEELIALFRKYSRKHRRLYMVTQFNHPREITGKSVEAVSRLMEAGMIVNNQTVLLKDVNDNPETLAELLNKLVTIGVNPYYVFQCRPVKRVKYLFQVPLETGYHVVKQTKKMLNGFSKRFKYVMSHRRGKIEIVGIIDDEIYFKFHQARNPKNNGTFFKRKLIKDARWLDDLD